MKLASSVRLHVESSLSECHSAMLAPRMRVDLERISCGVEIMDALLHGGLPKGVITELVGPECSGRTTTALTYVSALTQKGCVCAWVDAADALDLQSAAASGVDLKRLLWVRCGTQRETQTSLSNPLAIRTSGTVSSEDGSQPRHTGGGSTHPRSEARGMPQAITDMLGAHGGLYDHQTRRERKQIGTPGMPNRPLTIRAKDREEQINSDRLPPRRGDNLRLVSRSPESFVQEQTLKKPESKAVELPHDSGKPWQTLDQALRATDLLLQSGGFSVLVLDLGSTAPEHAWRIPLATWFRYRAACERTRVSLLLLTQHPSARSAAELVVRLQPGTFEAQGRVLSAICYRAEVVRSRSHESARVVPIRRPPPPERHGQWKSEVAWMRR